MKHLNYKEFSMNLLQMVPHLCLQNTLVIRPEEECNTKSNTKFMTRETIVRNTT